MSKKERLPFARAKELQRDYLMGMSKQELSKKFDIPANSINSYLNISPETRTEIEKQLCTLPVLRENAKITELKDELLSTIRTTLTSYQTLEPEYQIKNAHVLTDIISTIDRIQRLNNEKPTDIQHSKNETQYIDVAETIKALKSPDMSREQRIVFAQEQLANNLQSNHSKH